MLFKFFEKRVHSYPAHEPTLPPKGFVAFVWACARGVRGYVLAMAGLSALPSSASGGRVRGST